MPSTPEPQYEEQFTAFIDFLGFGEASAGIDDATRSEVLALLRAISALRGEFAIQSSPLEHGRTIELKPTISTFSDHIVISYALQPIYAELGPSEEIAAILVTSQFAHLVRNIAAAALRIGFLVRGGVTIGKLYHARGVVFGEALLDAYQIESRTSVYPRVVLSSKITNRPKWKGHLSDVTKCDDGLYQVDYFKTLFLSAAVAGPKCKETTKAWYEQVTAIIARNLIEFERSGKLNEFAKWSWFARAFRSGIEVQSPLMLETFGISLDGMSWPK